MHGHDPEAAARSSVAALSFGAAAGAYDRARPPYPDEAVEWLLPAGAARVLDLGAGTGKLTRSLVARGLDVVAVEPSAGMREHLARAVPGARVLPGAAEDLPLPDGCVDAVLVAQAWHWVDPARAVPEVARVLRSGGVLGLLWNVREETSPWTARLGALLRERAAVPTGSGVEPPVVGPPFGVLARRDVRWVHHLDVDGLADLVASRSSVIELPEAERAALLSDVRALALAGAAEGPGGPGGPGGSVDLPYLTTAWRSTLEGTR